ncbi:MAG: 4-(cytidine 5'-diphospho)-2-C-methyl-D-erythritol kinase [Spirochaetes bacterium]|nr:4-(cytidine 5'-diphospho)-2-C-methyl-D-erythritol kinase [Spirochaetota bacterium]
MGDRVLVLAPAKVNLHLEVFPPREDGYHPILSLFQSISWFDELEIRSLKEKDTCEIEGEWSIPQKENLIWKAVSAFRRVTDFHGGIRINVRKNIPMGAGLGGGSSDAASTLLGLNSLCGQPLKEDMLSALGATLGSDVPFFCQTSLAMVSGRGERISPIRSRRDYNIVVVVPPFQVSTREAYQWIDQEKGWTRPEESKGGENLETLFHGPIEKWDFFNAFQPILEKRYTVYQKILETFQETGALFSSISGSGSSMFGVYRSAEEAHEGEEELKQHFSIVKVTIPLDRRPIPILE